ncbi:MAG: phosphodiester glycosidase family protein, partial [Gaiellaceae bacterium]
RGGGTLVPPGGAVLHGRGFWANTLAREARPGSQVTVRVRLRDLPADVADAVGGGPLLVRNGRPVLRPDEAFTSSHLTSRHPRTAVGQLANGRVLLVVADGRSSRSAGLTHSQLAHEMARLGAVTAMGLDGGGSSTMAFDGRVLNRPSDGSVRAVASGLFVVYYGVYAPRPRRTAISPNGDGVADSQVLTAKVVRRSSVDVRLVRPNGTTAWRFTGVVRPQRLTRKVGAPGMAEGSWRWVAEATDVQSGRESRMARAFVVNRTLGHLRLSKERMRVVTGRGGRLGFSATLTRPARLDVTVRSSSGRVVRRLFRGERGRGTHAWRWQGRNAARSVVPSGTYTVRISAANALGTVALADTVRVTRVSG